MKESMTVKQLIALLKKVDEYLPISIEGCDCEGDAIGISTVNDTLLIRREDGCYSHDKLKMIKPDGKS